MTLDLINRSFWKVIISLSLLLGLFFCRTQAVYSSYTMDLSHPPGVVIEHLRLKVPKRYRQDWLLAEKESWEPWLSKKKGFVERELFWDQKNEEATILIKWSSREEWKNISQAEINFVQDQFESIVREKIKSEKDFPFPLIFEGELITQ